MKYFKLYSNCFLVEGHKKHIICDVQRGEIFIIPLALSKIVDDTFKVSMEVINNIPDDLIKSKIKEVIEFLITHELGHLCDNPNSFPEINKHWESPEIINNCIICMDNNSSLDLADIYNQLTELKCKFLELRMEDIETFINCNKNLNDTFIRNIDLYIKFNEKITTFNFVKFLHENQRIGKVVIFSTPKDIANSLNYERVFFIENNITNIHCGKIHENSFSVNIDLFMESQFHNSCLNRKISIDAEGNIKNCPSMSESFGNIKDTTLAEAIEKPNFKKYWNINKDKIHVCKDCEFRYICTDCRAYTEDPEDILSKPLKCGYNPYTGEWSEWSTNPLKQKAIDFYGMREIID